MQNKDLIKLNNHDRNDVFGVYIKSLFIVLELRFFNITK